MRGEQATCFRQVSMDSGPSPRARGAVTRTTLSQGSKGTIPACAGSSRLNADDRVPRGDHPRVRGEQPGVPEGGEFLVGPSPRARGADRILSPGRADHGTIPACAGSSISTPPRCPRTRDHPRVRGEQPTLPTLRRKIAGPSPRARGAGVPLVPPDQVTGTIPACAGSRPGCTGRPGARWDHPRVRGEQSSISSTAHSIVGPSPRARGAGCVSCGFMVGGCGF